MTVRLELQDGQPIDMFPTQDLTGTDELTPAERGDLEGLAVVDELDCAGERLPVVRAEGGGNADDGAELYAEYPYYIVGLLHEGSSGKQYYRLDLRATVQFADDL